MQNAKQRRVLFAISASCFLLGTAMPAWAHAFGQRYDLPLPLNLYLAGAGAAVALSFVVIGIFFRDAVWSNTYPRVNLLRYQPGRLAARPSFLFFPKLVAVLLFILVLAAGFFGNEHPMRNLAPTMVWVVWWVGLVVASAFIGNLWMLVNPWRTLFAWGELLYARLSGGRPLTLGLPYPEALGVWPAVVLLLVFGWLELVFPAPGGPANIAWMAAGYSLLTWTGMFLFGREQWLKRGEAFSLLFGLFARFAPLEIRTARVSLCKACGLDCRDLDGHCIDCATCFGLARENERVWALRPYAVGLLRNERLPPAMVAFVLLAVSTVVADGAMATPEWRAIEDRLTASLSQDVEGPHLAARTFGLVGIWLVFSSTFIAITTSMAATTGGHHSAGEFANRFIFTLVPIAIAYHLAHYLSYLLIQGQYVIPLLSDPFGRGWDLIGTAEYRVKIDIVGARFVWYLAVIAIVVGHVVAVFLAHIQALKTLPDRRSALRSQMPMTALMVAFTVVSLSILAEPIVRETPAVATAAPKATISIAVPSDAILPKAGSGRFTPVGPGKMARVALTYGAMTSLNHDGTHTGAADILYPFALAYRWGAEASDSDGLHDPVIDRSTFLIRARLVGVKLAGVDRASKSFRVGDMEFVREMVLVNVYLNAASWEHNEAAAVAPPWSSVPWHVLALMEEAVARGWAAFSETEAARRNVPWLDVVRNDALKARLATLVEEFARTAFVPDPLQGMVETGEARTRWHALKAFHAKHDHFLVTNGPYVLKTWTPEATVLEVFRDRSYPLGVGSYDAYAIPRRATIVGIEVRGNSLRLTADVEKLEKFGRQYKIVRETVTSPRTLKGDTLECRYLIISADGIVRRESRGRLDGEGSFWLDLDKERLATGDYTILVTLILNDNRVDPAIRAVPMQVR